MRYLEPIAIVALLLAALLACGKGSKSSDSSPGAAASPGPAALDPSAICAQLVAAKVARNCSVPGGGSMATTVSFDVVGIASYKGSIAQYNSDADYNGFAHDLTKVAADDYPNLAVTHARSRIIVSWLADQARTAKGSIDTAEGDRWTACVAHKPVAVCAKAQPAFYSANKAMYDAAKRAMGAK